MEETEKKAAEDLKKAEEQAAEAEEEFRAREKQTHELADSIAQYASSKSKMLDSLDETNKKAIEINKMKGRLWFMRKELEREGRAIIEKEEAFKYIKLTKTGRPL